MKILVTGANGYLGQGIVKSLLDFGHEVVAVDYKVDCVDSRAERKTVNLFSIDDPFSFFSQPDVLLHLAWRDGFLHFSDAHIEDLPKHYNFIQKMATSGIQRIAIMGSMHEIGFFEGSINENTPCKPATPYGVGKNALRELANMLCGQNQKQFQWLRGFYIVGNSEYGSSVFSKITAAEKEGKKEFPFTMGLNQYDFIDYDDFCKYVAMTILQNKIFGIINICSGRPEKLSDRVERFIGENNYKIKLQYGAFPDRPYDSKAVWGDDKKIKEVLKIYNEEKTNNDL